MGKKAGTRSRAGNVQDRPGTSCHQDCHQTSRTVAKGLRRQFEEACTSQKWNHMSIVIITAKGWTTSATLQSMS